MNSKFSAILRLALMHIAVIAIISIALFALKKDFWARSFGYGGLFFAFDVLLLGTTWSFIFSKKFIALAVGVSVFKWAIFGVILNHMVVMKMIHPLFFGGGCASFVVAALIEALISSHTIGKDNVV